MKRKIPLNLAFGSVTHVWFWCTRRALVSLMVAVQPDCTNLELGTLPYSINRAGLTTALRAEHK